MAKKEILFFMFFILLIPLLEVSALEINVKESYKPGETLIASFSGNFLEPLTPGQVYFYSGRTFIPTVYNIGKIQNTYYIYSILPDTAREYTLVIKNAHYLEQGIEKFGDLKANFSVSGVKIPFSVNPGFIITDNNFYIKINANQNILLTSTFLGTTESYNIEPGITKKIYYSIENLQNFTITDIVLQASETEYRIPAAIFAFQPAGEETNETEQNETQTDGNNQNLTEENQQNETEETISYPPMRFLESNLNSKILKNYKYKIKITLINAGQEDIENINFRVSAPDDIEISIPQEINLESGSYKQVNFTVISDKSGEYNATITAYSEDNEAEINLNFEVFNTEEELDVVQIDVDENFSLNIEEDKTCADLKGEVCAEDETCKGAIEYTFSGEICCIGGCQGKGTDYAVLIWIGIVIVVLIIGFFLYKKSKSKSSEDIIKQKSDEYEKRFESREIRGRLEKY